MKKIRITLFSLFLATPLLAQTKTLVNVDRDGVALQGYDPVAFFTDHKPVKGKMEFKSVYHGGTYYFASAEAKVDFDKDPAKFEPEFGGFCAFGVSHNKLAKVDPEAFQIVDGHLMLQYSKSVQTEFNKDTQGNLTRARANWSGLVEKQGKP